MARDHGLGERLIGRLVNVELVCAMRDQLTSGYIGVIDITYIALGSYLKNNVDITELFNDMETFSRIYSGVDNQMAPSTLSLMTWSLYIFTSRCFAPGTETP